MLKESEIEKMAVEVRSFLINLGLWIDTRIYFNGKAFATSDKTGNFAYNNPDRLIVLEDEDPKDYFDYVNEPNILSMSFEGPLYDCLNWVSGFPKTDELVVNGLNRIFGKYGCHFELGNRWNLTVYED